jgi:hypothetical protein
MYSCVGTPRAHDEWLLVEAQCFGERGAKESDDGVVLRLVREAAKRVAVVGEVEAPTLRSD